MLKKSLLFVVTSGLFMMYTAPSLAEPGDIYLGGDDKILKYDGQSGAYLSLLEEDSLWGSTPEELAFGPDGNLYGLGSGHGVIRYEIASDTTSYFIDYSAQLGPQSAGGLAIEPIPEPASLGLVAAIALAMICRRRRPTT